MRKFYLISLLSGMLSLSACSLAPSRDYQPPKGTPNQVAVVSVATIEGVGDAFNQAFNPLTAIIEGKIVAVDGVPNKYQTRVKLLPGSHTLETECMKRSFMHFTRGATTLHLDAKAGHTYIVHVYPLGSSIKSSDNRCWTQIDQVKTVIPARSKL